MVSLSDALLMSLFNSFKTEWVRDLSEENVTFANTKLPKSNFANTSVLPVHLLGKDERHLKSFLKQASCLFPTEILMDQKDKNLDWSPQAKTLHDIIYHLRKVWEEQVEDPSHVEVDSGKSLSRRTINCIDPFFCIPQRIALPEAVLFNHFLMLNLTNQKISMIDEKLKNFTQLETLTLTGNELSSLNDDLIPENLNVLYLGANLFKEIPKTSSAKQLKHLGLSYNLITSASGNFEDSFRKSNLISLDLSYNDIINLPETANCLSYFPNLKILWLKGNPMCLSPFYRKGIQSSLPNLKYLDDIKVDEGEKNFPLLNTTNTTLVFKISKISYLLPPIIPPNTNAQVVPGSGAVEAGRERPPDEYSYSIVPEAKFPYATELSEIPINVLTNPEDEEAIVTTKYLIPIDSKTRNILKEGVKFSLIRKRHTFCDKTLASEGQINVETNETNNRVVKYGDVKGNNVSNGKNNSKPSEKKKGVLPQKGSTNEDYYKSCNENILIAQWFFNFDGTLLSGLDTVIKKFEVQKEKSFIEYESNVSKSIKEAEELEQQAFLINASQNNSVNKNSKPQKKDNKPESRINSANKTIQQDLALKIDLSWSLEENKETII